MLLDSIQEKIKSFIKYRFFLPFVVLFLISAILIGKIFELQIVQGDEFVDNFTLLSKKELRISGTRGNIYDRNGELLAYNELAYSVTITDTIESGSTKNETLNGIILRMIRLIESNGDEVINDFGVYVDEGGNYCFSYEGTQHLRFLADIYGHAVIDDLKYTERTANPDEVMEYLSGKNKFGIGSYTHGQEKNTFFPMMGYDKKEILQIAIVRYQMSLNSFQKYIPTTVATDVSEKTVAYIMENSSDLQGVSIQEDTVRRYNHAMYFSPVIGYTGRISQSEYESYSAESDNYDTTDYVGKTGIEYSMEAQLQGKKGTETVYVDNMGKIMESESMILPSAGNDVYLTIDAQLQMAVYHLLEQKIAGIIVGHLENAKYIEQSGRDRKIPIYDVYSAIYGNSVVDMNHFSKPYAGENEKAVYSAFLDKQSEVLSQIRNQMQNSDTPYNALSLEMMEYQSFIISMLSSDNYGVILSDEIDNTDETYLAWRVDETISIKEYLLYCISKQWIDIGKLDLSTQYSDSEEIYAALVDYTITRLMSNTDFSKKLYKYMLLQDRISPLQTCMILWEQDVIQVDSQQIMALKSGMITPYAFVYELIETLHLTPSQLGLEPCSGSVVISDPNSGEVLALVSYPGYDNNRLANKADSAYLAKLSQDKSRPLWNNATQQRTAPGSCFKMVSSIAGVEEGVIDVDTVIKCSGTFTKLYNSPHKCWIYPGHHGDLTLSQAIQHSCNCFFYEVGYRLADDGTGYNDGTGIGKLTKYAEIFGFNEKTGVEITEVASQISDRYPVTSAIGQGNHNFTTVALARYISAIANSGTVYDLSLIHEIRSGEESTYYFLPKVHNKISLDPSVWNAIHGGLRKVVEAKSYFNIEGINAAGKTGTAQEATNKPNHALFIGYAPYENPQVAIAVRIANGYASDFAAQTACDCLQYYFSPDRGESLITGTASDATAVSGGD